MTGAMLRSIRKAYRLDVAQQDGCWFWLADFDTRAEAVTYAGGLHG